MKKKHYEADLHNHTTASDGALTPTELVAWAQEEKLKILGITDHDTIDGLEEALNASQNGSLDILPGIEITVRFKESFFVGSLHLLAYFDDQLLRDSLFIQETNEILSQGRGPFLTRARIDAINSIFAPGGSQPLLSRKITESDVYSHGDRISRRHFALALNAMGLEDRQTVSSVIGNDSPAYVPSGLPLESLSDYLRKWPFAVILAHPAAGSFPGENLYREVLPPFETVDRLMSRFIDVGLSGLEVEYPGHTEEWKDFLRRYMKERNLTLLSGGSDCHDRDSRPLGLAGVTCEDVEKIRRYCQSRSNTLSSK